LATNLAEQVLLWALNPDGTLPKLPIKFADTTTGEMGGQKKNKKK
jgi:hypothetical protein